MSTGKNDNSTKGGQNVNSQQKMEKKCEIMAILLHFENHSFSASYKNFPFVKVKKIHLKLLQIEK